MIAIIDYGVGNLRSVEKAFCFLGHDARISKDIDFIKNAEGVVLPGVGAFSDGMDSLKATGMDKLVCRLAEEGHPLLGICLGMQLLFDYSEEGGHARGLGIIPGGVRKLPYDSGLKIPHMGWNSIDICKTNKLFSYIDKEPYVYFVHSYYVDAQDRDDVIARSEYGVGFDVAVNRRNIYGTQFHPEKSGDIGLKILDNFAKWSDKDGYISSD